MRDQELTDRLEDAGYMVIRFGHEDDWEKTVQAYRNILGVSN